MALLLVCGSGRCGTSLVMQMLAAARVPIAGRYPMFEDHRTTSQCNPEWVAKQDGAIKLLDPHRYFPRDFRFPPTARAIWLTRDKKQQAKSWFKFNAFRDKIPNTTTIPEVIKKLKEAQKRGLAWCRRSLATPPLVLTFELAVNNPAAFAEQLVEHFNLPREYAGPMALQSVERPSTCIAGMLENDIARLGPRRVAEIVAEQRGIKDE